MVMLLSGWGKSGMGMGTQGVKAGQGRDGIQGVKEAHGDRDRADKYMHCMNRNSLAIYRLIVY